MGRSSEETQALGTQRQANGQSLAAYGVVNPVLTQMATNPTGLTPQDRANLTTSSMQTLGGSVAGLTGFNNLQTARTNNAGGYTAGNDAVARDAMRQGSQNALGVDLQDAAIKRQQQQFGVSGLQDIYGDANRLNLGAIGAATQAENANRAGHMGWLDTGLSLLGAGQGADGWKKALGIG